MEEKEILAMLWGMIMSSVQDNGAVYLDKEQMEFIAPIVKKTLGLQPAQQNKG